MEYIERSGAGRKRDIAVAILFSLLMHGVILLVVFQPTVGLRGRATTITAAQRLSHMEEYIFKDLQGLVTRYHSQAAQIASKLQEQDKEAWTLENMPASLSEAVKTVGVKVSKVQVWPSRQEETNADAPAEANPRQRYTIAVTLQSESTQVFNDILAVAHTVGHGTLTSDFLTDNLEVTVVEKEGTEKTQIIVPTMDCRLLRRNKISPQEFLMGASVRRGISG